MAVVKSTSRQLDLLARLMRAEAEGDGQLGMLLVGNVGVNRVLADCLDFRNIRNLEEMVFQKPGGFVATTQSYFYQRAREQDRNLARRVINGERFSPGERSLWFFDPGGDCPPQWYNQWNTGRFKTHCFYSPTVADCPSV
ncbi:MULTISPECIES: cell wall hydrolase [Psychrobacillus]|uniref:Cell wall hydrolase n=1 Tax=Psychrobacillus lasiicapitis TaxID=1636719 RepID=A0A544TC54_9BACI|nr:cell wall hydrolase [Psychrobacillus lasiicapitis]TQR15018.1 cell wall hydrolase [Psychrobacillus lasiicapitis]GGA21802.1 cell wall hydrolase [Psychrobacillus lasiicapitis]